MIHKLQIEICLNVDLKHLNSLKEADIQLAWQTKSSLADGFMGINGIKSDRIGIKYT